MSVGECKANLQRIIDSIIHYYDKEKGWILESNIPIDPIFDSYAFIALINFRDDIGPLVLIIRWVITTILFSAKKTDYITTILTLSPQTQVCLQCIIEAVMNSFPLDDEDSTSFSEMHSRVNDSVLSVEEVNARKDSLDGASLVDYHGRYEEGLNGHCKESDPYGRYVESDHHSHYGESDHHSHYGESDHHSHYGESDLHNHYEEEMDHLEKQIISLQQSLSNQREETEMLHRQRDELQREVIRMESELKEKREIISGLEGQERRRSSVMENQSEELKEEIRSLRSQNDTMSVRRAGRG